MTASRCPRCDRDNCPTLPTVRHFFTAIGALTNCESHQPHGAGSRDTCPICDHWRALALAAESERNALFLPRWTPGALSHDFGGRDRHGTLPPYTVQVGGDRAAAVACHWPARWRPIAVAILDLPVPVRDEPAAVIWEVERG